LKISAPAKVNLRLEILARETLGYHQLETVFCALELADELEVVVDTDSVPAGGGVTVEVTAADVPGGERNLAHRAASAFTQRVTGLGAVSIHIRKRIPAAAGLGGGSSDAASTLLALNELAGRPLRRAELLELGATLGADVPFFACGSPLALAWGRGDRLLPLPPLPSRPVLVAVPPFASPTAEAYSLLAAQRGDVRAQAALIELDRLASWEAVSRDASNAFERPLFSGFTELADLKAALSRPPAMFALLSGSGSSMFAVFEDAEARDRAAARLAAEFPRVTFIPTATAETVPIQAQLVDPGTGSR